MLRARARCQGAPDDPRRDAHPRATRWQLARAHRRPIVRSPRRRSRLLPSRGSSRGLSSRPLPTPAGTHDGGNRLLGGRRDLPPLLCVPRGAWPAISTLLAPSSRLLSSHLTITCTHESARCCLPTARPSPRTDAACFSTVVAGAVPPRAPPAAAPPPLGARRRRPMRVADACREHARPSRRARLAAHAAAARAATRAGRDVRAQARVLCLLTRCAASTRAIFTPSSHLHSRRLTTHCRADGRPPLHTYAQRGPRADAACSSLLWQVLHTLERQQRRWRRLSERCAAARRVGRCAPSADARLSPRARHGPAAAAPAAA